MPAIVRVKRRIDEEPLSAFVLNGKKRRRLSADEALEEGKDEISTILKFAGTIKEQDDAATTQLARLTKAEAKQLVQQKTRKPTNHTERARQEMRQSLHDARFRVVNCMRTTLPDEGESATAAALSPTIADAEDMLLLADNDTANNVMAKQITILDIEKQQTGAQAPSTITTTTATTTTAQQLQLPSDSGYVYDLYIPENEQQADYVDLMDDNYLSVRAFDLNYDDRYKSDSEEDDSEDSNQENYFANDYPDEEENASDSEDQYEDSEDVDVREMTLGVERFMFANDDEDDDDDFGSSSSDDDENYNYRDPYVGEVETTDANFVHDIDSCDVDRYGMAYARYKARVLKRFKKPAVEEDEGEAYHSASENDN